MKANKSIRTVMAAAALVGGAFSAPASACNFEPFIGSICLFGGNFDIRGYAFAQGQLLSIAQNTALFSILGTQYGGNGQTTFALPDTRGRVVVGQGQGPGRTPRVIGETGGSETVTLSVNNLPPHSHSATTTLSSVTATLRGNSNTGNADGPGGNSLAAKPRNAGYSTSAPNVDMAAGSVTVSGNATTTIGNTGGGQPFSIMPPYLVLNYLIALEGIFPSRN